MTKLTQINRRDLKHVSDVFLKEVQARAAELGLTASYGGGQYGGSRGTIKIDISLIDTGDGKSGNQTEFEQVASWNGVDKGAFGKTFMFKRDSYTLDRGHPNSPKYCFGATRSDGTSFKFPAAVIKKHFPSKAA